MIVEGIVSLPALLAHFPPLNKDEDITTAWRQANEALKADVNRIGVISLTAVPDADASTSAAQQQRPSTGGGGGVGQTASKLDLDARRFTDHLINAGGGMLLQRTYLLAALLQVPGGWDHAQELIQWLAALEVADTAVFPHVGKALCALVAAELDTITDDTDTDDTTNTDIIDAITNNSRLQALLPLIGYHFYHDTHTLTRLIRLVAKNPSSPQSKTILRGNIFPTNCMIPANPALSFEIWNALKQLPYLNRFVLYSELRTYIDMVPLLKAAAKLAETEVRRILRRVTAPTASNKREARQSMRPLGRLLAKITHANPLIVCDQLLRQVMGMPGMVVSISEALSFLTPLTFDVLTFNILVQLTTKGRRKVKEDGIHLEEWFQWLASFIGVLVRKYEHMELTALAQYVLNRLKGSESLDLLVLWEIVATMTGVAPVFEVSDYQLDALAGSELLISEVIVSQLGSAGGNENLTSLKDAKVQHTKGMQRLIRALRVGPYKHHIALPMIVLMAQQRKLLTLQSEATHLKLVAELYDRCQEVIAQYTEFLQKALTLADYAELLPSMTDLAVRYRVDPEIVFALYRPLIRSVVPPVALVHEAEPEEGEMEAGDGGGDGDGGVVVEQVDGGGGDGEGGGGVEEKEEETEEEEEGVVVEDEVAVEVKTGEEGNEEEGAGGGDQEGDNNNNSNDGEEGEMPNEDGDGEQQQQGLDDEEELNVHHHPGVALAPSRPVRLAPHNNTMTWEQLTEQLEALAPQGGFKGMSPTLYAMFWALELYDIDVPTARYSSTLSQVHGSIRTTRDDLNAAKREFQRPSGYHQPPRQSYYSGHHGAPPPPIITQADIDALAKQVQRLESIAEMLPGDEAEQKSNATAVDIRLFNTRGAWCVVSFFVFCVGLMVNMTTSVVEK